MNKQILPMEKTLPTSLNHKEIPKENITNGKNSTDEFKS